MVKKYHMLVFVDTQLKISKMSVLVSSPVIHCRIVNNGSNPSGQCSKLECNYIYKMQ